MHTIWHIANSPYVDMETRICAWLALLSMFTLAFIGTSIIGYGLWRWYWTPKKNGGVTWRG